MSDLTLAQLRALRSLAEGDIRGGHRFYRQGESRPLSFGGFSTMNALVKKALAVRMPHDPMYITTRWSITDLGRAWLKEHDDSLASRETSAMGKRVKEAHQ